MNRAVLSGVLALGVLVGCSQQQTGQTTAENQQPEVAVRNTAMPGGHPPIPGGAAVLQTRNAPAGTHRPQMQTQGTGVVVQALQSGGYTYVEVEQAGKRLWIAGKPTDLKAGQQIAWRDGATMRNFRSKTLNRVFPELMFVSGFLAPASVAAVATTRGVVRSIERAAGYSYVAVDTEQGNRWLALPEQKLTAGDRVAWAGGSQMRNFHSKSLDRTFDEILFLGSIEIEQN